MRDSECTRLAQTYLGGSFFLTPRLVFHFFEGSVYNIFEITGFARFFLGVYEVEGCSVQKMLLDRS